MTDLDLDTAADRVAALVRAIPDDLVGGATPCAGYSLAALLDHVDRVAQGFTAAAAKADGPAARESALGDPEHLASDWRTSIPQHLAALAPAWRDPAARTGMTRAGGIDLPGEVAPVVALEELVIHGWDIARATGQPFDCDAETLEVVRGLISQFTGPGAEEMRGTAYAMPVGVSGAASLLDEVVALSGRDPGWTNS